MAEHVVLVDRDDREVGTAEKLTAHAQAKLHRALSVFVSDGAGRLLLQRRARGKYHSGGLWSNTCCGHPRPDETVDAAAHRRLREEMGFDCPLERAFAFTYRADVGGGLVEHEHDHVFVGRFDGTPRPDPREVEVWRWVPVTEVLEDLDAHPDHYTAWFRLALDELRRRGLVPA